MAGRAYIGTSGFTYDHWREVFYPVGLNKRKWLEYYSEAFDVVEINSSYYRMPRADVCAGWARRSPEGFVFVTKLNGLITHRRRLVNCKDALEEFLRAIDHLGEKLGPILVQLPPRLRVDVERLSAFLDICPEEYRWAVEFRHLSWLCEEVYDVLRAHKSALVCHDMIRVHPQVVTTGWTYLRFHGPGGKCSTSYPEACLDNVAGRIGKQLDDGLDVYTFFTNDAHGYAVINARTLKDCLGAI